MSDPAFPDAAEQLALAEECRRCPGLVDGRERICWGVGPTDADVVVVGEAPAYGHPGADRWRGGNHTGMAYTGRRSGRKIRGLLAEAGVTDAYYTNAVKCYPSAAHDADGNPTGEAHEENRAPTDAERANCRPYLREEVRRVDPETVLATGNHATRSLLAVEDRTVDGFLDLVLKPHACPTLGATVVPLLHPSYQEVWLDRLGYGREQYLAALRELVP